MNAPAEHFSVEGATEIERDRLLIELLDAWTKRQVIEAYSFGHISQERAIRLIRENGLLHA